MGEDAHIQRGRRKKRRGREKGKEKREKGKEAKGEKREREQYEADGGSVTWVTVRVKLEEGSSDQMQPPGALPEFADSQVQQLKAHHKDRPLEKAGDQETPGPEDELLHVTKEEPPPNPDPGAGTLSRADQQPPKKGPVKLELQRPSRGRRGQS
ncbi:hypothetical protein Y1Q_0023207 [Alligator mississippiensis]|uniref:Uncharacterized protein n=2 Tax=Alligator mississippiensis TaxID=8496 RepID=A0A151MZE2_ALLMI|nr:hypothetical protein Y1Q_0023207 [Alligator mississippiensis]